MNDSQLMPAWAEWLYSCSWIKPHPLLLPAYLRQADGKWTALFMRTKVIHSLHMDPTAVRASIASAVPKLFRIWSSSSYHYMTAAWKSICLIGGTTWTATADGSYNWRSTFTLRFSSRSFLTCYVSCYVPHTSVMGLLTSTGSYHQAIRQ